MWEIYTGVIGYYNHKRCCFNWLYIRMYYLYRRYLLVLLLSCLMFSLKVNAHIGLSFASGDGVQDITPYRAAISFDFGPLLCKSCDWGLVGIWESSGAFWHGSEGPNHGNDKMKLITSGPVFRWHRLRPTSLGILPYVEAGVGLSWLSQREIGGRKLSLHFQFEDNVGVGFRFGKNNEYDITYRLFHYSNASLKRPNSGVNIQMINLGLWFN